MNENYGLTTREPATPDEVLSIARDRCLQLVRKNRAALRANAAASCAADAVRRTLRSGRPVRHNGSLRFPFDDCVRAIRAADTAVTCLLAA